MNVVSLKKYRQMKQEVTGLSIYKEKLVKMPKIDLLQELLRYHEDYMKNPLDLQATLRGKMLLEVMESRAELPELQVLTRSFRKKLADRLASQLYPAT